MNWVKEYYRRIECGDIVTSKRVRAVYSRLVAEMDAANDDSPYYFDEETGERPILFIETFCKQSQGTIGAPLELELFQKAYIQLLFGWLEKETGYRRFRETMFLCGRKNGKSTLLSGIALYMLIADYEGAAEIYSVATKKDQAKKVLTEAVNMVKQSPELRAVVKKRRNDIYFPATSSIFEALASDSNTLDGLNSHAVIIDELHAIRDRNLYEVMKQSTSSRRQPLVVMITTAGTVRECIFDNMYELAADLADGKKKDDTFLPILYELDSRDEWTNPQMWIKANPGLGKIKQYKTLANFVERAKNSPADLPGVLCKDFNIRENESAVWLSFEQIKNAATFAIDDVYNTYAIGGCDLSATTDLTAATLLIAIYSLKGTDVPSEDILRTCFRNNPDGAGFAFNKDGKVQIVKGFMNFDSFISAFKKYDTKYGFKDRGVLIHFRIATHGGVNVGCCHPFPISSNEKQLKKSLLVSDYAVIHNGIIFLTADKKNSLSDTMIFIKNYLTKISSNNGWFYNKKNTELIYELIDSKMAIINGKGNITATEGFHKGEDGNYYSNTSYKSSYFGLYDDWLYDDLYSSLPLMRLKKNETVCYEDGKTEEYESGFHNLYPLYLTKEGDVYADYCGSTIGDNIPMDQLTYLGKGSVFNSKSPMEKIEFRKDAVGFI